MFKESKYLIVSVILSNSLSKFSPFTDIGLFFLLTFNESKSVSSFNFLYSSIIKPISLKLSGKALSKYLHKKL
jgi:hypothetical protein